MSSIVWSLKRLFDPAAVLWEESELDALRTEAKLTPDGDPPDVDDEATAAATEQPRRFQCRVCGHCATEGPYCLRCLADTMQPLAASSP